MRDPHAPRRPLPVTTVFGLTTGSDTAGINIAITHAFRRHAPEWTVNSLVASQNYIGYPVDDVQPAPGIVDGLPYATRYQVALERLYDAADVVHIHNTLHAHRWYDNGQGKPTVLMHHGMHSLDEGYRVIVADARNRGMVQVGSTLDLSVHEPDVEWLPAPVDLERMRAIRAEHYRPHRRIRVGHAPTNRAIKGSDAFDAAMSTLYALNLAEPVVIQGKSWADCLAIKATCDVFFDQPVLGYGSNAIEAWAMGIPVVAGVQNPTVRAAMLDRWGVLPFVETTEATLERSLRALVADADLRREYAARGTAHVEQWHDERRTVRELRRIYAAARPTVPGGRERRYPPKVLAKVARIQARQREAVPA